MAKLVDIGSIGSYFESLSDPRHARNRKHLVVDLAVIAVCGIICGCDGPTAIHRWAKHRQSWLALHLALPNGIPSRDSHSTHSSSCSSPRPSNAASRPGSADTITGPTPTTPIVSWPLTARPVAARTIAAKDLGALHIVSAWASEQGIALGQVATDAKSNEITAIPQLLEQIDLKAAR